MFEAVVTHVALCVYFFFQAEDGIRDIGVTGVQTCALPIYDDDPGRTFHDRHIRLGETANLINALGHLKQSVCGVELRLTPKTWIYGRRRLVLKKCPAIWTARVGCCRDESPHRVLEVLPIAKQQL